MLIAACSRLKVNRADFEQEGKDRQEAAGTYKVNEKELMDEIQALTKKNLRQANEVERTFCIRTFNGFHNMYEAP